MSTRNPAIAEIQQRLLSAGFDPSGVDGIWGNGSRAALDRALDAARKGGVTSLIRLAWGAKVSAAFREKVIDYAHRIGVLADDLMGCMAWESGRTFSPAVKNMAGSGATGLIQFMPATALALGTSVGLLELMTAEKQLDWVLAYFMQPMFRGRLKNLGDLYMAILWPAGVGQPDSYVLWDSKRKPTTYRQNAGLDQNKDGLITRGEAVRKVLATRDEGFLPGNVWTA